MTTMTLEPVDRSATAARPSVRAVASAFDVTVDTDWASAAPQWRTLIATATTTPFQQFAWLDAWYRHIAPTAGVEPRLVTVRDRATGDLVMLLPLVAAPGRFGSMLSFADNELSDFNAPILGPVSVEPGQERALWSALASAHKDCTVANFRKMPRTIGGRDNPLTRLPSAYESSVASNAIALTGTFKTFHESIDRRVRMELERCWRVLQREGENEFEHVTTAARAHVVLDEMDRQQRERLSDIGSTFSLDQPAPAAFYRDDLAQRLAEGTVQLTCLRVGNEIVAAQYAITNSHTAVVLRIGNAGKNWSRVSPGRLIVHKSIEHFYQCGLKVCDLSIGDYEYKRRFGVVRTPLVDRVSALTWRGRPASARHWAVSTLRHYPALDHHLRRFAAPRPAGQPAGTQQAGTPSPGKPATEPHAAG